MEGWGRRQQGCAIMFGFDLHIAEIDKASYPRRKAEMLIHSSVFISTLVNRRQNTDHIAKLRCYHASGIQWLIKNHTHAIELPSIGNI